MTHFNYGGRIGMSQLIRLVIALCDLFVTYGARIKIFVAATTLIDSTQKATLVAWLDGIVAACEILRILQVTYESK